MSDRCNFYFKQLVQEDELDLAFEQLEAADRNLVADVGIFGIVSGAIPVPHEPLPNLTIDLTAPGRSYDRLGQRVFFGTDQSVDCSVDYTGVPTEVSTSGNERWIGVFLKFDRLLSDPRTDGNSQQVYFRQDESFQVLVRQGAEAAIGTAQKVALPDDEILVCDVRRTAGQTQIVASDIDLERRQAFIFANSSAIEVDSSSWERISPIVNTVQAALDSVDTLFDNHFKGDIKHKAEHVTFDPANYLESDNVQSAVTELMDKLESNTSDSNGASRIGAKPRVYLPVGMPAGTVDSHLEALVVALNGHITQQSEIHPAAGITVSDLDDRLSSENVEDALQEILKGFETEHYRYYDFNPGMHRTIRQPSLGSGRVLLFHSKGSGSDYSQLRIFADSTTVWFTVNADWNAYGDQWVKDTQGASGAIQFGRSNIRFQNHYHASDTTFADWSTTYRLPMASTTNSAMELSGEIQEIGRMGLRVTNSGDANATISAGGTVTFRARFPDAPSSVSLTQIESSNWTIMPIVTNPDRDGFCFHGYQNMANSATAWWYGTYTAKA